jgi:capsular polysaccharide transport system permease protein
MTDSPALTAALPARPRQRHWGVALSFLLMVVAPTLLAAWYMTARAADRYVSTMAFSVRTEEAASAIELLGIGSTLSSASTTDPEILYDFIQSQELVRQIEQDLDLRAIWSRVPHEVDPIYAYDTPGTIEDLTGHWRRMVGVYTDTSGLIELRVQAFTPDDAQDIAEAIYDRSSEMINALSAIARADATGYAREELDIAVERLKEARGAVTLFRNRTQIVDPQASIQSQLGILSAFQSQLAEIQVDIELLEQTASANDPRLQQLLQRQGVVEQRIEEELTKFGGGGATVPGGDQNFADLVAEFESLRVDLEFAEESYRAALATYDAAVAEARRQSRYLAAHVRPTLAESSTLPRRGQLTGLVALFSFLVWGLLVLAAYALRDRR